MLCKFRKLLEALLKEELSDFSITNHLFPEQQFGLRLFPKKLWTKLVALINIEAAKVDQKLVRSRTFQVGTEQAVAEEDLPQRSTLLAGIPTFTNI